MEPIRIATWLQALNRAYGRLVEALAALTMAAIVAILFSQVFYRYVLVSPLVWAEEASRCLLIWMCFLFAGAALQRGHMAAIEMLIARVPPRPRALILVPAHLLTAAFLLVVVYYGWRYAQQNRLQLLPGVSILWRAIAGPGSSVSIFWLYLAVPVGSAVLAAHILLSAARVVLEALAPRRAVAVED